MGLKVKEFEGEQWVLKSDVDGLVQEKLSAKSGELRAARERIRTLESEASKNAEKVTNYDTLARDLATTKQELQEANSRYDRHTAIAGHGITDPEVREAIEWAVGRHNGRLPKNQQQPLQDVLRAWIEKPESAPVSVRHHIEVAKASGAGGAGAGTGGEGGTGQGGAGGDGGAGAGGTGQGGAGGETGAGEKGKPAPIPPPLNRLDPGASSTQSLMKEIGEAKDMDEARALAGKVAAQQRV